MISCAEHVHIGYYKVYATLNKEIEKHYSATPSTSVHISSSDNVLHTEVFSPTHSSQLRFPMQACKQRKMQACVLTGQSLRSTNRRAVMDMHVPFANFRGTPNFC